ncbi:MAG: hypothetical protein U0871_00935 [Gemmataceae bacterium]
MPAKAENKPFSTRLPDDARARLRAVARAKGLTESDLGRMFILDGLAGARAEGRTLAALVIAALSPTLDFDQATDLVAQHLTPDPPVTP